MRKATTEQVRDVLAEFPEKGAKAVAELMRRCGLDATNQQVAGVMASEAHRRRKIEAGEAKALAKLEGLKQLAAESGLMPAPAVANGVAAAGRFIREDAAFPADPLALLLPVVRRLGGIPAVRKALDELAALLGG